MTMRDAKAAVRSYWDTRTCGTSFAASSIMSRAYFDEIAEHRYRMEPQVFSFAQFTRFHSKKVLEVGVGAGADLVQWARAGAMVSGVDLTPSAVQHASEALRLYGLHADIRVADAEDLPYPSNEFDLVYSWGVIHHTPDTRRALHEIIRVTRPGGKCKIMVYNRRSVMAWHMYFLYGLLRGRPLSSLTSIIAAHQENTGTKAYTGSEVVGMLSHYPVRNISIQSPVTRYDMFDGGRWFMRAVAYVAACLLGFRRAGWFMMVEFDKE